MTKEPASFSSGFTILFNADEQGIFLSRTNPQRNASKAADARDFPRRRPSDFNGDSFDALDLLQGLDDFNGNGLSTVAGCVCEGHDNLAVAGLVKIDFIDEPEIVDIKLDLWIVNRFEFFN